MLRSEYDDMIRGIYDVTGGVPAPNIISCDAKINDNPCGQEGVYVIPVSVVKLGKDVTARVCYYHKKVNGGMQTSERGIPTYVGKKRISR